MGRLLTLIDELNRKERYFVFTEATGNRDFRLSREFSRQLSEAIDTDVPESARGYVDYHLDWIHAAVHVATTGSEKGPWPNPMPGADDGPVATGNQEDVDLLVCFTKGDVDWLVMVEAKGDTSWGAAILRHKAERLKAIFGKERARRYATINPAFCLWSPKESDRLITDGFPEWMLLEKPKSATRTLRWMRLDMPEDRKQVFRCDESGTPSATGTHWTIKQWRKKRAL